MPQHDLDIANASGAAVRTDLNNALAALGSAMKGPNAPPAPLAGMIWVDDDTPSATVWTVKQYDGADWIELGRLDITNNAYTPSEGVIAWADVASAATVDLGAQASRNLRITGTTGITSFGTAASGVRRELRFAGVLTLTNSGSLILPGGANITTAAGDTATAISLGSGNWVVTDLQRAAALPFPNLMATARVLGRLGAGSGAIEEIPLGNPAAALSLGINRATEQNTTSGTAIDFTGVPAGVRRLVVMMQMVSTTGGSELALRLGTSGGIVATGYDGIYGYYSQVSSAYAANTTGLTLPNFSAAWETSGIATFVNQSGNLWLASFEGFVFDGTNRWFSESRGFIDLGGTLDRFRLTTLSGTPTFDKGKINLKWEF